MKCPSHSEREAEGIWLNRRGYCDSPAGHKQGLYAQRSSQVKEEDSSRQLSSPKGAKLSQRSESQTDSRLRSQGWAGERGREVREYSGSSDQWPP